MRNRALSSTLAQALAIHGLVIHGLLVGAVPGVAAEPTASALPASTAEPTAPTAALSVAAPAAMTAERREIAAQQPEANASARGERNRVLSYIILQGLQGVGPFVGGR